MKKTILQLMGFMCFAMIITASEAQAQTICIFEHVNYQGRSNCFNAGNQVNDLVPYGFNDLASSIAFYGPGTVTVCEHVNMGGRCLNFNSSIPDLVPYGFNDTMSSLQVGYGGYPQPGPQPGPYPHPHPGPGMGGQACFFEHINFGGRSICLGRGQSISNLTQNGFNDLISSVSISGRARVTICEHDRFNGACRTIVDNTPNLVPYGFNDITTSISVE